MAPIVNPTAYHAFLLRCWQESGDSQKPGDDRELPWRFSIEEVGEGTRRQGFANLEDLIEHLRARMNDS